MSPFLLLLSVLAGTAGADDGPNLLVRGVATLLVLGVLAALVFVEIGRASCRERV